MPRLFYSVPQTDDVQVSASCFVFEGAAPRPAGRLSVEAWSSESLQGVAINRNAPDIGPVGRVSGGGTFEIIKVSGTRTLRVNQLPSGWVVKSITAAGRDLMDVPIEFKSGEDLRDVVIVLSDRETEVTGTVTDEQRAPASGVSVLIFPDDKRRLPARARWLRPDSSGNFTVSGLPPGDYFAALAEDIDDLQWTDAAYLDRFREQATPFRLGDAEHKMLPLRWSAPR